MGRSKNVKKVTLDSLNLKLHDIEPITDNHEIFFDGYDDDKSQLLLGYPGTGKTFMAMYKALKDINNPKSEYRKILIVRSAVPTRDMGFLPGTLEEKGEVYELPYRATVNKLFGRDDAYDILRKHHVIEFITTSFVRGLTLDKCILLVDEFQNMTAHEADSVVTRDGQDSKVIFCGDMLQQDLTKNSEKDIDKFLKVIKAMPEDFDMIYFTQEDIVRSDLVANYIKMKHSMFPDGF